VARNNKKLALLKYRPQKLWMTENKLLLDVNTILDLSRYLQLISLKAMRNRLRFIILLKNFAVKLTGIPLFVSISFFLINILLRAQNSSHDAFPIPKSFLVVHD